MVWRCSILSVGYGKDCFSAVNKTVRLGPFSNSGPEKLHFQTLKSIQSCAFQASVLLLDRRLETTTRRFPMRTIRSPVVLFGRTLRLSM